MLLIVGSFKKMTTICNRKRERLVPWMSGLVGGLLKPCTAVRIRQEPQ